MATNYPGSVDSYTRPSQTDRMNAAGVEGDVVIDNLYDAVEAIETELGTDPSGAQATVKARLEYADRSVFGGTVWLSGGYLMTNLNAATAGTVTGTTNYAYYVPWWCPQSVTVDRLAVEVQTAVASANARLGIYAADATTNGPGALVLDAGEIDCSATGVKELTVSQSLTGATLYRLSLLNETTNVIFRAPGLSGMWALGLVDDTTVTTARGAARETRTYTSGFLSTATAMGSLVPIAVGPTFWLRRS